MYIQQLYTKNINDVAYYIESNGECAIIDPLSDIEVCLLAAKERNATIKYIFATHYYTDFISAYSELAGQTNAPIVHGPLTKTSLPVYIAKDDEKFTIGDLTIKLLHTPGLTLESCCYLLKDENLKDYCLFTGNFLYAGNINLPDTARRSDIAVHDLADMLYESIQNKIIPLADDVIVYPAHHEAGSSIVKSLKPVPFSTIAELKQSNEPLLQLSTKNFIKAVIKDLEIPPNNSPIHPKINKEVNEALSAVLKTGLTELSIETFKELAEKDKTFILDSRNSAEFTRGFVPGSISIGLEGRFAEWAAGLLPFDETILLVCDDGKEEETILLLARAGFDKVKGFLKGGFTAWQHAGETVDLIIDVEADELAMDYPHDTNLVVMDVRKETEFADGHVKDAVNLPLNEMNDLTLIANIEERNNLYIHCAGGYRSVIAASLLKRHGFHNLRNVIGGFVKIKEQKIPVVKETSALN